MHNVNKINDSIEINDVTKWSVFSDSDQHSVIWWTSEQCFQTVINIQWFGGLQSQKFRDSDFEIRDYLRGMALNIKQQICVGVPWLFMVEHNKLKMTFITLWAYVFHFLFMFVNGVLYYIAGNYCSENWQGGNWLGEDMAEINVIFT